MSEKHTAENLYWTGSDGFFTIRGTETQVIVAVVSTGSHGVESADEALANAVRLALRWNSHDELVSAVTKLAGSVDDLREDVDLESNQPCLAEAKVAADARALLVRIEKEASA